MNAPLPRRRRSVWLLRHAAFLAVTALGLTGLSVTPASLAAGSFTASINNTTNTVGSATLAAPTLLTLSGSVNLSWTATTSSYASGTRIFRATSSGGPYVQIAQLVGLSTTTYTDSPGTGVFFYVVVAYYNANGANWTSVNSNEVRFGAACSAPGTVTVTADLDTYTDSLKPTTAFGTAITASTDLNRINYAYIHFPLAALPTGCSVTLAKLQVTYTSVSASTPTVSVYNAIGPWTEGTTWNTQPGVTGSPTAAMPTAPGAFTWQVTGQVQAQYAGTNNGFELQPGGNNGTDAFTTRETLLTPASVEMLTVTFG